jgi:hypothetical protein
MPVVQRLISISVQSGVPEDGELVYNIHVTNNTTGLVWDIAYKFSQLATLDHDIAYHTDKVKEIPFPQIDETIMAKLSSKKHYAGKLQDLNKYRTLIETWIQQVISRAHLMPFVLYQFVEDWFCLPVGPDSEWQPGRALSTVEIDILSRGDQGGVNPTLQASDNRTTTSTMADKNSLKPQNSIMKFLGLGSKPNPADTGKDLTGAVPVVGGATPEQPLLKVRVQRGQKGRNGKVEYDVSILHHDTKSVLYIGLCLKWLHEIYIYI